MGHNHVELIVWDDIKHFYVVHTSQRDWIGAGKDNGMKDMDFPFS